MKRNILFLFVSLFSLLSVSLLPADEGMFPISEVASLDLSEQGLELTASEIFNPDEICLVDGVCRVNGCTGSFVSPQGLIITNHHCAYRAIQTASSEANDYLKHGFQSSRLEDEIPAVGYTVRITEGYRDVSEQVLSAVQNDMSFLERTLAIEKRRKELESEAEQANPGQRAEVAEMFVGKSYVLFLYTYIKDVRLVFAPPAAIGNYGGDIDNWEWPRHTGDFAFVRAYVAPDGSTAEYASENVPYQPKRFIQVAPQGVSENDFVMLLGYPGRTARHKTASYLRYLQEVYLPYIVQLYQWQIARMEEAGQDDRAIALKHSSRSKSLANVEKRSRGQLKGLVQKNLVAAREAAEAELQAFIESSPERAEKYGSLLQEIDAVYAEMNQTAHRDLDFANLRSASRLLYIAFTVYSAAVERAKPDVERDSPFMDRNFDLTKKRLMLTVQDLHLPTDRIMLREMLLRVGLAENSLLPLTESKAESLIEALLTSELTDADFVTRCLEMEPAELEAVADPGLQFAAKLYPIRKQLQEDGKSREGRLNQLYGDLTSIKQEFLETKFVPDANGTLRLTYGRVEGYSPEDAVYKSPLTTLGGAIAKSTGQEPFDMPAKIVELHQQGQLGSFSHPDLGDIPTCMLYSTDTTGGNSGSPIFNGRGELVGVNFDRAFEATINDFAWDKSYSRSIGVDIRYVLWITGEVFQEKRLLEEMGVGN